MRKAPDPFTFADVFRVIRKNLLISLLLAGAGGAGAYVVAQGIPDRYAATAQLISDASRSGLITTNNEGPDETGDATATSTMVETIGTSAVLNHALTEMSPEGFALLAQSAKIDPIPTDLAGMDDETRQALLRALSQSLTVNNSGRSFVVNLNYLSESPLLSADAANAVNLRLGRPSQQVHKTVKYRALSALRVCERALGKLLHKVCPLFQGVGQGSGAQGFGPGGAQLLTFLKGAGEAHGQAEAVGVIVEQMIHVEGVQGFGPGRGSPEGQGQILIRRADAHQLLRLRQQGDKFHLEASPGQFGRAGGQHVQFAHAFERSVHKRDKEFVVQAFQHGADENQFFLLAGGDFAGGHAAAALQNEFEKVVVEP